VALHRAEEAADVSASIFNKINQLAVATRWRPQTPPTNQLPQQLRVAIYYSKASIPSERIIVGGGNDDEQERLLPFLLFIFIYFLFSPRPLSQAMMGEAHPLRLVERG
jgi:hypothetical protein